MRAIILLSLLAVSSLAHKLNLFVTDENATIYIRAYFTKSAPCQACDVLVSEVSGAKIAEVKTDENGEAIVRVETREAIVRADGGMGHEAEIIYELTGEITTEKENPLWFDALKILAAIATIAAFFGMIWLIKRKKRLPSA
jgi:hypothetical protein